MNPPTPRVRSLYAWEEAEARKVFAGRLDYERVVIHENDPRPDILDRASRRLRGMPPLPEGQHNAMTIGNHCFFPVELPEAPPAPGEPRAGTVGWLMHELGHAWQFQRTGWRYILQAIWVQMVQKGSVYTLPGLDELREMRAAGKTLFKFSVEQQCDILKNYYLALCDGGPDAEECRVYGEYVKDVVNR